MRTRLVVILALIVISPLAVGGWLGAKIVRDQRLLVEHRTRSLALGQGSPARSVLGQHVDQGEGAGRELDADLGVADGEGGSP